LAEGCTSELLRPDLRIKHEQMAAAPFFPSFVRPSIAGLELWPRKVRGYWIECRNILSVGDLHVENFGTLAETTDGRLVWGN